MELIAHSILEPQERSGLRSDPPRHAIWTDQMTCIRHSITAIASAATPRITVLQRLRSMSAHSTAPTGRSTAETR